MRITMNSRLKVTSTQLLISRTIELFLKILSLGEDRNALLPFSPCQQGKLQFRSRLPLSSSHCPASQHRHRYQRWQICEIKTSLSHTKELMCRIRMKDHYLFITRFYYLFILRVCPCTLLQLALVRPLTAFARTFCILEVLQIAASSNVSHPNEIHCLWMERSGLMRFFLPHVPWIHQSPKWNWRSTHLFASREHSCSVEGKQMWTKLVMNCCIAFHFWTTYTCQCENC